jgi:excisionase family DNA binding protein
MPKQVGDITLYSLPELAEKLDVHVVTLRRHIKSGKLKATRIGTTYHVTEEALREFLAGGEAKPSK